MTLHLFELPNIVHVLNFENVTVDKHQRKDGVTA